MKMLNDYLTVGTTTSYLGVSKATLRRWDAAGKLKARRHPVTGFRLYLKEELHTILAGASLPEVMKARTRKRLTKR